MDNKKKYKCKKNKTQYDKNFVNLRINSRPSKNSSDIKRKAAGEQNIKKAAKEIR